jgi:ATP-dependent Clp protease ATP-binding subunit ClpA
MTDLPISLDNLISYVQSIHADSGPLANLSDAVQVANALNEHSDSLIGYFVDQARHSGASWSEIGASLGVSKQAVQKRFVARDDDDITPGHKMFKRFTPRARNVVKAARRVASLASVGQVDVDHMLVALLVEPGGIAARVIHAAGVSDEQILAQFGLELPDAELPDPPRSEVRFATNSKNVLREALMVAVNFGHNYIGTEHILLGIVRQPAGAAPGLDALGLTRDAMEAGVDKEFAEMERGL